MAQNIYIATGQKTPVKLKYVITLSFLSFSGFGLYVSWKIMIDFLKS